MAIFVRLHLGQAENGVLTLAAVVVRLLAVVTAAGNGAVLGGCVLLEPRRHDAVELLVLAPVGDHFVGICAVVVALQTVEMAGALLVGTCNNSIYNIIHKSKIDQL